MALEKELALYEQELPNLLKDEGKYVLIGGDRVVDVFSSYDDALKAGYKEFKLTAFLVKRIQQVQQVHFFTRDIQLTCATVAVRIAHANNSTVCRRNVAQPRPHALAVSAHTAISLHIRAVQRGRSQCGMARRYG